MMQQSMFSCPKCNRTYSPADERELQAIREFIIQYEQNPPCVECYEFELFQAMQKLMRSIEEYHGL